MQSLENVHKPSLVHIIDSLHTGGAERVLVTLANIFYRHGHRVKVITIAKRGALVEQLLPGIEQANLGRTVKLDPFVMRKLIRHVKDFDVVHVHSFFNLRYLWLAKILFGLNKTVFYHEHFGFRANMQADFWQKYILPKTIFIATTAQINNWAVTKLGMPQSRVFTLPNIVLAEPFTPRAIPAGKICRLVLVSNIRTEKNIEFGITLLQHLNQQGNNYTLTIIGKPYNAEYYAKLQQLIQETGTASTIRWVHNADNVQQLLGQFDIGLHTSPSESGPLAVIEYLAQGLPFVAYNTGEVIKTIKSEVVDCIAFTFNADEWEAKIQKLLSANQTALSRQLRTIFEKRFSEEAYYNQCMNIYEAPSAQTPSAR